MRASDVRLPSAVLGRGRGRFSSELSPVRILSPLKYCEAIMRLQYCMSELLDVDSNLYSGMRW